LGYGLREFLSDDPIMRKLRFNAAWTKLRRMIGARICQMSAMVDGMIGTLLCERAKLDAVISVR
jgi:hypothetical protein